MAKYVIEYSNINGYHVSDFVIEGKVKAAKLASSLVMVFCDSLSPKASNPEAWDISGKIYRITWRSNRHFVALSILDSESRGPASGLLWSSKKELPPEGEIVTYLPSIKLLG